MLIRLACIVFLIACAPSDRLQRSYSHDNGVWQTVSRDTEVFRDGADHVLARTIILEGGGEIGYFLSLSILRGKSSGPRILTVMHNGKQLDYILHDRVSAFCIDHCHKTETGQIRLSQTMFRQAANAGMTLQINGLRREYTAEVPARLFYSALEAANLLDPMGNVLP